MQQKRVESYSLKERFFFHNFDNDYIPSTPSEYREQYVAHIIIERREMLEQKGQALLFDRV